MKEPEAELAEIYRAVFKTWIEAFKIKASEDVALSRPRAKIASLFRFAYDHDKEAVRIMEALDLSGF